MKKINSKYTLAALDSSVHINTVKSLDVHEVPLIKYYEKGKFITNYSGKLASNDITKFILGSQFAKDEL